MPSSTTAGAAGLCEQHERRKRHGDDTRIVDGRPVRPRDEQSKRGTFGRLFDKRPDAPCVAHRVNASLVVDLHGDLLVADLDHEVQIRILWAVSARGQCPSRG